MYLEDLSFCIKRAGWKVKKTHSHITFEPSHFKLCQKHGGKFWSVTEKKLFDGCDILTP